MEKQRLRFGLPVHWEGMNLKDCRDICYFWDDFLDSSMSVLNDISRWKTTVIAGVVPALLDGTDASQELAGGIVTCAVGVTASKSSALMVNGEQFQIAVGHELYFEARFTMTHIDVSCFVGLSNEITTQNSANISPIASLGNGMGFLTVDEVMATSTAKSGTNVDAIPGITVTALTWYTVAIHYDGDETIRFYIGEGDSPPKEVNSLNLTLTADRIPNDIMLTPTIEAEQQGGTSGGSLYVDYILCQQARQRIAD